MMRTNRQRRIGIVTLACGWALSAAGCSGLSTADSAPTDSSDGLRRYPLSTLPTSTVKVNQTTFRVWLAQDFDAARPGIVQEGLMHVRPHEMADDQGMLFVFSNEREHGFWMLNTITPLDIAFARQDGTIVQTWEMAPETLRHYPSVEPAMFALEVKQGTFAQLGIGAGDVIEIPLDVFDTQP